jgi:PAS domain S-box-containing protein
MPMVVADARGGPNHIVLANQAFLRLTGYDADEVIGRDCRFLQGERTSPSAVAEIRRAIVSEQDVTIELLNYRKDGTSFWNQLFLSPIHAEDGRLMYIFGSQLDVTERRRAQDLEAVQRRLLREVDHRAMNVLAIVQGIVRMTRADDAADYAHSVQARVRALSQAHSLLASGGWAHVPFSELLRVQIEAYESDRVAMAGPDVLVPAHIAQSVALVLHELIDNAARHGALSSSGGSLHVHWHESDGQKLRLHWTELGAPKSMGPIDAGFGFKMIDAIVERQLGGSLTRDWQGGAINTLLSIPLRGEAPAFKAA